MINFATTEHNDFKSNKSLDNEKFDEDTLDNDIEVDEIILTKHVGTDYTYKHQIVWKNAIGFLILYVLWIWGTVLVVTGNFKYQTFFWTLFCLITASYGVTIGAHRLFSHRTFKAKPLLRAILILFQTAAGQNCLYIWCRDHRLHHRYSDTDGDPHNSKRGFFFSHVGWLMHRKHPYVKKLGKRIDMSDLEADWMVMFQKKYYYYLYFMFAFIIPVFVPWYFWGESFKTCLLVCYIFRYLTQLNGTWLVNSAAHLYGTRPYDKNIQPVESWFVSFIGFGEGWHNYHHVYPWDYKAAELSTHFNSSALLIEFFHKVGLAYDLKSVPPHLVKRRVLKTGDGTHYAHGNDDAKKCVTAVGPVHPMNPSYNVNYKAPDAVLKGEGLPLYDENDVLKANLVKRKAASG